MPMSRMLSPYVLSQACRVPATNAIGNPDEKPSSSTASIRLFAMSDARLGRVWSITRSLPSRIAVVDGERRAVGEAPALVDRAALHATAQCFGDDLIDNAPADVLRPGRPAIGPPRVLIGLLVDDTKCVNVARESDQLIEPGTFLGQEARVLLVRAPVAEVDLLVRDVPVAAQNVVAPGLAQFRKMRLKDIEETELRRL